MSGLTSLVLAVGFGFSAIPLFASLGLSAKAKNDAQIQIPISKIPQGGAFEFAVRWRRLFITRDGSVHIFAVSNLGWGYIFNGADRLWEIETCRDFRFGNGGFYCADYLEVQQNLRWDRCGRYLGHWGLADLPEVPFQIEGDKLQIGPVIQWPRDVSSTAHPAIRMPMRLSCRFAEPPSG